MSHKITQQDKRELLATQSYTSLIIYYFNLQNHLKLISFKFSFFLQVPPTQYFIQNKYVLLL